MHKISGANIQQRGSAPKDNVFSGEKSISTAGPNLNQPMPMQNPHNPLDRIIVNGNVASPLPKSSHLYKI